MPTIEIDFPTFKAITALRPSEDVSEGDVIRELVLGKRADAPISSVPAVEEKTETKYWWHKGVEFPVGLKMEHEFRGGRTAVAEIVESGVLFDGKTYRDLSPAGKAAAGYEVNGWDFWNYRDSRGNWVSAKSLRRR